MKPGGKKARSKTWRETRRLRNGNRRNGKNGRRAIYDQKKLEQLRNKLNKEGKGEGNKLNPLIEELKKQEEAIINKNISKKLIDRQSEILTRLLESEKAIIERGLKKKENQKKVIIQIMVTKLDLMSIIKRKRNKLNY